MIGATGRRQELAQRMAHNILGAAAEHRLRHGFNKGLEEPGMDRIGFHWWRCHLTDPEVTRAGFCSQPISA
jgi:hypothetical protein